MLDCWLKDLMASGCMDRWMTICQMGGGYYEKHKGFIGLWASKINSKKYSKKCSRGHCSKKCSKKYSIKGSSWHCSKKCSKKYSNLNKWLKIVLKKVLKEVIFFKNAQKRTHKSKFTQKSYSKKVFVEKFAQKVLKKVAFPKKCSKK